MKQATFNFTGEQLSQAGQELAISHANAVHEGWSEKAYRLLREYVACYGSTPFRAEEVRSYAALMDFPMPPHARAWGSIFTKGKRIGLIKFLGTTQVKNPKAHCANAGLWVRA